MVVPATGCKAIVGPYSGTPEWYAARAQFIGASEAAAACGMSEWMQPRELYLEKRGERQPKEPTQRMRIGNAIQPAILSMYGDDKPCYVDGRQPLFLHPDYTFIGATPDALCRPMDLEIPDWWPTEAKNTSGSRAKREIGDTEAEEVPTDWLFQCQQQMFVLDKPYIDLAILIGNEDFRIVPIKRNQELIDQIVDAITQLWDQIKRGIPPPIDYAHSRALELVRDSYKVNPIGKVLLTSGQFLDWQRYEDFGGRIKHYEQQRDAIKASILDAMGDAATGFYDGVDGSLTLKRIPVFRKSYVVKESQYVQLRRTKA